MDTTRKRILPDAPHTRADRMVAYRAMAWAAELLLGAGASVILDAPYGHMEDRRELAAVAERIYLVECAIGVEASLARLAARGPDGIRLDLTPENAERLVREYPYSRRGLLLDTACLDTAACLARVDAYLDSGSPVETRLWPTE